MLSEAHVDALLCRLRLIAKSRDNHVPSFFAARIKYLKLAEKALPVIAQEVAEIAASLSWNSNIGECNGHKRTP